MSRALRDLHFLFEDASHIALSSPAAAPCREVRSSFRPTASAHRPKSARVQFAGSVSSLGVVQRLPLRRHTLRASTPGISWLRACAAPLTPFGRDLPPPDSFRPCRSTRLRRLAPLERRGLVASRSRPWGSLRFITGMRVPSMFPAGLLRPSTRSPSSFPRIPRSVRPRLPPWVTLRSISLHLGRATPPRCSSLEGVAWQRFREGLLRVAATSLRSSFSPIPAPRSFDLSSRSS